MDTISQDDFIMARVYLAAAKDGDVRLFLLDGEPIVVVRLQSDASKRRCYFRMHGKQTDLAFIIKGIRNPFQTHLVNEG